MTQGVPNWRINRTFSRQLRHFFWVGPGSLLLKELPYGWFDGGCLIASEGLCWWVNTQPAVSPIHLALVVRAGGVADHVVVECCGHYLDADGLSTRKGLLQRWACRERLPSPRLVACEPWRLQVAEIPHNQIVSRCLGCLLTDAFGPFHPSLLFVPSEVEVVSSPTWSEGGSRRPH